NQRVDSAGAQVARSRWHKIESRTNSAKGGSANRISLKVREVGSSTLAGLFRLAVRTPYPGLVGSRVRLVRTLGGGRWRFDRRANGIHAPHLAPPSVYPSATPGPPSTPP